MAFDIEGARKAGYSDSEIADYLGAQSHFDTKGARNSGYSDTEILQHLSGAPAANEPQMNAPVVAAPARVSAPSPNTVPEQKVNPALADPYLGYYSRADRGMPPPKDNEQFVNPMASLLESLSEKPDLPSLPDTWEYTKGQLATAAHGVDMSVVDSKVKDFEQNYNRNPADMYIQTPYGPVRNYSPNSPANINASHNDPQYKKLVEEAQATIASGKEIYGDLHRLEEENPSFWGRVLMKIPGSIGLAAPAVSTAVVTRNIPLAAAMAFPTAKYPEYGALRTEGVSPDSAELHSDISGAISSVSSAVPMGQALKYGTPLFNRVVNSIATTLPTASVASIADEVNNYAATLPRDMTLADWQQAVQKGLVKLPETWALASANAGLLAGVGHATQKYEPGQSYSPEIADLIRAGADAAARGKARDAVVPQTEAPTAPTAPAPPPPAPTGTMRAPPVSGSPPPDPNSPKASAPIGETGQGAATPPVPPTPSPAPVAEQTTAPAPTPSPGKIESAAPPASPAPKVPEPTSVPQTQPASTTAQEPPAGGAVVSPSQPVAETNAKGETPPVKATPLRSKPTPAAPATSGVTAPTEHMPAPNETTGSAPAPKAVTLREESTPGLDVQEGELSDEDFKRLFGQQSAPAADTENRGQTTARPSVPAKPDVANAGVRGSAAGERPDAGRSGPVGEERQTTGRTANNDQPPRVGWRDKTAVRDKNGEPRKIWRGSTHETSASDFTEEALGHATQKPVASLGVYHTVSKSEATEYGTPRPAYLDIRNPKLYTPDTQPNLGSKQAWVAHRAALQKQGFDGIHFRFGLGQPDWYVAFHPDQVVHDPGEAPAPADEAPPSTEGFEVTEHPDAPSVEARSTKPEPQDQGDAVEQTKSEDPLPGIAARKAKEGEAALQRRAAATPEIAPKRDTRLGRSSFDSMWRDLAPQAQAGETSEGHAKRTEAWVERMRNAPVDQQIKIAKQRTTRVFGFKDITIDPRLKQREALDVLLDAYNNLSTNSAITGLPAEAMGFNEGLSLRLNYRIGNAGTRGMFSMKFGQPFEESATIQLARRADSFVHEWMHALDFNMLTRYFLTPTGGLSAATNLGTSTLRQGQKAVEAGKVQPMPDSIRDAFSNLMRSIYLTDDASVQKIGKMALELENGKQELAKATDKLKRLQAMSNKETEREKRAVELEAQAAKTTDKMRAEGLRRNAAAIRQTNAGLEGKIKAAQAVVDQLKKKVETTHKGMNDLIASKASHLLQGSMYVDKLSGQEYFSMPTELMARAGESWIGNMVGQQGGAEFLAGSPTYYNKHTNRLMQLVYPNELDRARINQAFADLMRALGREEYFTGDTHSARIPGDTRIDKDLWTEDQTNPAVGEMRSAFEGATEDVKQLGRIFMAMRDPATVLDAVKGAGKGIATVVDAAAELPKIYYSGRGRILSLAAKNKANPRLAREIKRVGSLVTTDPGSGEVQGVTLEREVAAVSQMLINRVARIAQTHNLDMNDAIQMDLLQEELVRPTEKVRNELTESLTHVREQIASMEGDRNKEVLAKNMKAQADQIEQFLAAYKKPSSAPDHIRKAADAMRKIYDEQWYEAEKVGIDLGYVSNYQQRTLNRDAIESNAKGFLEQAQKVYAFEQLRKLRQAQIAIDKVESEIAKWRAVERRTGNELPRVKALRERAATLRAHAAEVKALDPKLQAEEWLYAARTGEMFRFNAATPPSKFVKERQFGPVADILMRDFYDKNPLESLYSYATNSARRIAYARRFGDDHAKRRVMMDKLRALGMKEKDIDELNQTINVLAGYHSAEVSHSQRLALDVIYNTASMALLPLNLFNQLAEPLTAGLRTGRVRDGLINLGYTMQAIFGAGDMKQMRVIGDAIGIISRSGHDQIAMSRLDGADLSKQSRRWMADYQARTGVHGYTNASRLASMKLGGLYVKSVADLFSSEKPAEKKAAAALLKELGIAPADHERFSEYARSLGNLISIDELTRPENYDLKMQYVHAIHGFVDGVIGSPKASDKPLLAAHPVGRFITALQSFNYYFQRHQVIRGVKQIGREGVKMIEHDATMGERAKAAGDTAAASMRFLLPMMTLLIGTLAYRILRDALTNQKKYKERMDRIKAGDVTHTLTDAADLAGVTGPSSQLYNYAFPNKLDDKHLSELVLGSHAGFYIGGIDDIKEGIQDEKDPNDTSNSAERKAARAFYRMTVNTLVPALMTEMGLKGPVGFISQAALMSRGAQNWTAESAFPPTVNERYNTMKRDQRSQEAATMTPDERALKKEMADEERANREAAMEQQLLESE